MIVHKHVMAILLMLVFAAVCTDKSYGMIQERTRQARLELDVRKPIKSASKIRIRVFPHFKDYRPHGVDHNKSQVQIRSDAGCTSYEGMKGKAGRLGRPLLSKNNFYFDVKSLEAPIWLQCKGVATLIRQDENPHFSYLGAFYIRKRASSDEENYLEVINIVSLKQYLKGVVPSEVYADWPVESLRTQAVAARTYAVFHIARARKHSKRRFWDVDDTIKYQAYTGVSLYSQRTSEAVEATKGQILTYKTDVIQAYYHADSGGQTEDAVNVWNFDIPYVQGRKEAFNLKTEGSYWSREVSLSKIAQRLRSLGFLERKRKLLGVAVPIAGRSESGRVRVVTLRLNGQNMFRNIPVEVFKKAAGRLPSTLFAIESNPDSGLLEIKGLGSGHGVGMSQQGAAILAEQQGWSYNQILNYYYIGTTLCELQGKDQNLPNCYEEALRFRKDIQEAKLASKENAS